ncbi:uncharacterized protein G2W53_012117 [Senna tora]|uniref:Uncharacterized protein n=1 Tax=Senna tora TaxID=362788 RepID=A0A834U3L9_9FABA|nr:uncharacterized protein G2W53_012117 [Senna tora]
MAMVCVRCEMSKLCGVHTQKKL